MRVGELEGGVAGDAALLLGVAGEGVERHHARQSIAMADVVDVALQVGQALVQRGQVGLELGHAAGADG